MRPEPVAPVDAIRDAVRRALAEDIGTGDITTESVVPPEARLRAAFVYREPAIVAGLPVVAEVFAQLGAPGIVRELVADGGRVAAGEAAAVVEGAARPILTGERTAVNFLQRLSGVAMITRQAVEAVAGFPVRILDTRKTTPTLRALEKYAVAVGGGDNHRFGLFDGILIKDNHIAGAGGVAEAVRRAKARRPAGLPVQVEVETLDELAAAIAAGANAVLLDNMTPADVRQAVALARGRVRLEASGGITLATVAAYAASGVDDVSLGALTHSAPSIDIGLDVRQWT